MFFKALCGKEKVAGKARLVMSSPFALASAATSAIAVGITCS